MCTELLPPGGYPIAVKYIVSMLGFLAIMDIQDPVPYCNERFYCNCTYIIYRNAKI
jgi:hypothetical protein